jgi:hypothetical protein
LEQCRQIQAVDSLLAAGRQVQLVLRTSAGNFVKGDFWATRTPEGGQNSEVSYPPRDLRESGSETYAAFLNRVLGRYCKGGACRLHSLVVENEANNAHNWSSARGSLQADVDDYVALVAVLRDVVRADGLPLKIYDSGLQGFTLLWLMAAERLEAGDEPGARAVMEEAFGKPFPSRKFAATVGQRLNNPSVRRTEMMLASGLYTNTDGDNFHHYHAPESVAPMVDFLRRRMPKGADVVTNETGIKASVIGKGATEDEIEDWMARKIAEMFRAGVTTIIWFSPESLGNAANLVDARGGVQRRRYELFRSLSGELKGGVSNVEQLDGSSGPGGAGYRLTTSRGDQVLIRTRPGRAALTQSSTEGCEGGAGVGRKTVVDTPAVRIERCMPARNEQTRDPQ